MYDTSTESPKPLEDVFPSPRNYTDVPWHTLYLSWVRDATANHGVSRETVFGPFLVIFGFARWTVFCDLGGKEKTVFGHLGVFEVDRFRSFQDIDGDRIWQFCALQSATTIRKCLFFAQSLDFLFSGSKRPKQHQIFSSRGP